MGEDAEHQAVVGLLTASLVGPEVFTAVVEGFAALGSVVGVVSALAAFLALVLGDSNEAIGEAVNYGVALGFIPGFILGAAVFYSAATTL